MHKLVEYICGELEELERKADKDGKLSMAEVEYADKLAHLKKNLLKSEEMMDEGEYSGEGSYARGRSNSSYARGRGRNSSRGYSREGYSRESYARGGYSRDGYSYDEGTVEELKEIMEDAPQEVKKDIQRVIRKMESM